MDLLKLCFLAEENQVNPSEVKERNPSGHAKGQEESITSRMGGGSPRPSVERSNRGRLV